MFRQQRSRVMRRGRPTDKEWATNWGREVQPWLVPMTCRRDVVRLARRAEKHPGALSREGVAGEVPWPGSPGDPTRAGLQMGTRT